MTCKERLCPIKLSVDDAKIYYSVQRIDDFEQIQMDQERLQECANQWQFQFHPQKCTMLREGSNHPNSTYYMMDGGK